MTAPTVNGRGLLAARIALPLRGVWFADVEVDGEDEDLEELLGEVEIRFEGIAYRGRTRRGGSDHGRIQLEIAGGAGGLETILAPRYYVDAPAGIVLRDLARETGEELASDIGAGVTGTTLPRWTRGGGRAGDAVAELARSLGKAWRVRLDGTLWVGDESWPAAELEHDVLADEPAHGRQMLGVDVPSLEPGTTLNGRRVSHVVHDVTASSLRTQVWFDPDEEAVNPDDVVLAPLLDAFSGPWRRQDRTALYAARVVAQADDRTLEVRFDDARWPSMTRVPIRVFAPGARIAVAAGTRVLVGWEEARPDRPYAALWESGTLRELALEASTKLVFDAPTVEAGGTAELALAAKLDAHLSAIAADFTALIVSLTGVGGSFTPTYGTPQKAALDAAEPIPTTRTKGA